MDSQVQPFNIMIKPVSGRCNLACAYCYYTSKPAELYPGVDQPMMTPEVLESVTRQYIDAMGPHTGFNWQGGEPLLAGLDFYRQAVALQDRYRQGEKPIANALQTNGTLLDDAWCEFFAERGFLVGISLDGPAQWNDAFRRDRAGRGTFDRAWAGLELLRRHRVEHNVLVTLNSANAPHAGDIYRYFVNRGVTYLQFIPVLERGPDGRPSAFSCSAEQYGRFLLEVFDQWSARDVGRVSERLIDGVIHQMVFGAPAMCCQAPRCANAHVVEFNGDLYACDHFVYERWRLGNIMSTSLAELLDEPRLEQFARLKTALPDACRDCEFLEFCNGGCPKHHMPLYGGPDRVNHFCEGYKMFFREALPDLRRMAEHYKRGQTPSPQPRGRAAPSTGSATKPGRNDPCPCGSGRKFKSCCGRK